MEREPAIRSLTVQNLLSFGEKKTTIDLQNLNVLIGANGSGKSNLIEVIGLLQSTPRDLGVAISAGGSIDEWLWKGSGNSKKAYIAAELGRQRATERLMYVLGFAKVGYRFEIVTEMIDASESKSYYYNFSDGHAFVISAGTKRDFRSEDINPKLSILAQRKDPDNYPEVTQVGDLFGRLRLYKGWEFGSRAKLREPCDVSLQAEYLEEDGSNLAVVLDRLLARPAVKDRIIESLQTFYENVKDVRTTVEGGKVQTRLEEKGLNATIPLIRMSDGTVRWLALLAVLLSPDPPPLVAIEEPELGLHPDVILELAKLLVDASTRTQLIITTHSTQLIEAFTDRPEAVIVCEKENGASTFRRLDKNKLSEWLKDYSLSQLWTQGQIGGTRW